MDANFQYCINSIGKTNMVGRPAIYKTAIIKKVGMDISFNGVGNEDTALSIKMEKYGAIQGKGSAISFRSHPPTFKENLKAWKKYGLGDAQIIKRYPDKIFNIIKHLLYNYPIKRSIEYIKNGKMKYIGFPILIGYIRFFYLIKGIINGK
jgi:hypothetical protein